MVEMVRSKYNTMNRESPLLYNKSGGYAENPRSKVVSQQKIFEPNEGPGARENCVNGVDCGVVIVGNVDIVSEDVNNVEDTVPSFEVRISRQLSVDINFLVKIGRVCGRIRGCQMIRDKNYSDMVFDNAVGVRSACDCALYIPLHDWRLFPMPCRRCRGWFNRMDLDTVTIPDWLSQRGVIPRGDERAESESDGETDAEEEETDADLDWFPPDHVWAMWTLALGRPDPVFTDLNGNNGEWTNTDDNPPDKRRGKFGQTREPAPAEGFKEAQAGKANATAAYNRVHDVPVEAEKPKIPDRMYHVVGDWLDLYAYVDEQGLRFAEHPIYPVKRVGVISCASYGPGWCVVSGEEKKNRPVYVGEALEKFIVPAHWAKNGLEYKRDMEFLLPTTLVHSLRTTIRPTRLDSATINALQAKTAVLYRGVSPIRRSILVDYLCLDAEWSEVEKERRLLDCDVSNRDPVLAEVVNRERITKAHGRPFRIWAQQCDLVNEYVPKKNFAVRLEGAKLDPDGRPEFDTKDNFQTRVYDTAMFSLEGVTPFVKYDMTGHNANLALKRIVGARDAEDELTDNQRRLGQSLAKKARLTYGSGVLNPLGYEKTPSGDVEKLVQLCKLVPPTWQDYEMSQHTDRVATTFCESVLNRCSRAMIQSFLDACKNTASWGYYQIYAEYLSYIYPKHSQEYAAEIAHVKRMLRRCYVRGEPHGTTLDLMIKRIEANVKKEWAKPGKVPRLFVAYGAGCMYANELPEFVKLCFNDPYVFERGGNTYFVHLYAKPSLERMDTDFDVAIRDQGVMGMHHIFIYSDDSVYMGTTLTGDVYKYNVDIKSCDSSNGPAIFLAAALCLGRFDMERAIGLVQQCSQKIYLRNPSDPSEIIVLDIESPFEGSGTVLTTILNHIASLMIAISVIEGTYTGTFRGSPEDRIKAGAAAVGHEVTVESCVSYEKIQFLKRSPLLCKDGRYHLALNAGCVLRGLGKVEGDLSAKQLNLPEPDFNRLSWNQKMERYISSVVEGLKHEPSQPWLEALRSRFNVPTTSVESHWIEDDRLTQQEVDTESFLQRYQIDANDLDRLCKILARLSLGDQVVDDALTSIYFVDYTL